MSNFEPRDAYTAALLDDGLVVACDLSNPGLIPILVAEFTVDRVYYLAFYHDDLDRWEINGPKQFHLVCDTSDPFWNFCIQTVNTFHNQLLRDNTSGYVLSEWTMDLRQDLRKLRETESPIGHSLLKTRRSPQSIVEITINKESYENDWLH